MLSVDTILQLTCVQLKEPNRCNLNSQITPQLLLKERNNLWQLTTYPKRHKHALGHSFHKVRSISYAKKDFLSLTTFKLFFILRSFQNLLSFSIFIDLIVECHCKPLSTSHLMAIFFVLRIVLTLSISKNMSRSNSIPIVRKITLKKKLS